MDGSDLNRMANQIADFFAASGDGEAAKGVAAHIRNFWEPRMRQGLYRLVDAGGEGLDPLVIEAAAALRKADKAASGAA